MILLVTLLRIVPYAMTGLLAYQKGYKRLSLAMAYVIGIALLNYFVAPPQEVRSMLALALAGLLLWHATDLEPKRGQR